MQDQQDNRPKSQLKIREDHKSRKKASNIRSQTNGPKLPVSQIVTSQLRIDLMHMLKETNINSIKIIQNHNEVLIQGDKRIMKKRKMN